MPRDSDQSPFPDHGFGAYLRTQRQLAQLTLRQLAELSKISNPYLSQIERGLHQPSVAVIRSIADALNLSADVLLAQVAGIDETDGSSPSDTTESAIRADPRLNGAQKAALLSVYRSMVGPPDAEPAEDSELAEDAEPAEDAERTGTGRPRRSTARRPPAAGRGKRPADQSG